MPRRFDPEKGWDVLAEVLDDFCAAWESSTPLPEVRDFVGPIFSLGDPEFCKLGLIETIKVDLEYRSRSEDLWKPLESYIEDWPQLVSSCGKPPAELMLEEFQHLKKGNPAAKLDQYERRFKCELTTFLKANSNVLPRTTSLFRSRATKEFQPGQTVDDFDLLSKLGKGAFASVFLARQKSMQRLVALKISANQGVEGQTLAQLDHPHIVRVYDQRALPNADLRLMYMQYVAGTSLFDLIKSSQQAKEKLCSVSFLIRIDESLVQAGLSSPIESINREWIEQANWSQTVARIGAQLASALHYAHSHNVLHRDLKPANVLVDEHGYPKIVDFNVSFSSNVLGATAATYFGGSLAYMSPEQLCAMDSDADTQADDLCGKCDVYSLGILLYELLIGERPFDESQFQLSELLESSTRQRLEGLSAEAEKPLDDHGFLLGQAIKRSLAPELEQRLCPESLKQQLQWASESEIDKYLTPRESGWRGWTLRIPFLFVAAAGLLIAIFATWFIISYNVSAKFPDSDLSRFKWLRTMVNRIVFPASFLFLFILFRPVNRILTRLQENYEGEQLETCLQRNLDFGHFTAVLFAAVWTVAGVIYPIGLTIMGADLPAMTWYDFIGSHFLAGLITASYVYCVLTWISLIVWQPQLILASLRNNHTPRISEHVDLVRKRLWFYQVLAIATPMLAVTILVNLRQTTDTFSLGVLSLSALFGLFLLGWTSRKIQGATTVMQQMRH